VRQQKIIRHWLMSGCVLLGSSQLRIKVE